MRFESAGGVYRGGATREVLEYKENTKRDRGKLRKERGRSKMRKRESRIVGKANSKESKFDELETRRPTRTRTPAASPTDQSEQVSPTARTVFFFPLFLHLRLFFFSTHDHRTQITARVVFLYYPGVSDVCVQINRSHLKPSSRGLFQATHDALMT